MSRPTLKPWLLLACIAVIGALPTAIRAQSEIRISGIVRDLNTHREISNANIFIKGTQRGTVSDFAGRYELRVPYADRKAIVVFQHIAYEPREMAVDSVAAMRYVYMQPRVISLGIVTVESETARRPEIAKDLPQTVSLVEAKNFEIRGYVDAGDLLRTDHSVQVEEELSGKKTVAIRGGNADEVVVLYNGVKLNSTFDNEFDLSLIDLEDIERFEVIKGSNTTLYGAEAFSGVINIVPKVQHDYSLRFQQRFGTYRSGNWGLHVDPSQLWGNRSPVYGSYSFKRGATKRNFVDDEDEGLSNTASHHIAYLGYNFSEEAESREKNNLGAMYIHSLQDYDNRRDGETVSNLNKLLSLKYTGDLAVLKDLALSTSWRQLNEHQVLNSTSGFLNRDIEEQTWYLNMEKNFKIKRVDLLLAYQFQHANLDYLNDRAGFIEPAIGLKSADFKQQHHGAVAIAKLHSETGANSPQIVDLGLSLRHDFVRNEQFNAVLRNDTPPESATGLFTQNDWRELVFNFSFRYAGVKNDLSYNTFIKFGTNAKFPTLFQQINSADSTAAARVRPNLNPEENTSIEVGFTLTRETSGHPSIYGWELSGIFFQNHYANKFRYAIVPGSPVVFYDNVPDARISGFEAKPSVFFLRKKVTLGIGFSRYYISEKAAFPFKSDLKRTLSLIVDHAGYSLQGFWFQEGEQVGLVRQFKSQPSGDQQTVSFAEIVLPSFSNLDVHLSKSFEFAKLKLFVNASGRNLLNSRDVVLQGLALRDRRYYLTLGAQY
ncbi:TonB-dependent receptor [candidate division KSB1 bacterium]|nr:TonB-dependent receptor [candidate division KSB1 bacterium]